jgi:hypothetical protein
MWCSSSRSKSVVPAEVGTRTLATSASYRQYQSSTNNPSIRANSRRFRVTSVEPRTFAIAAICRSIGPIGAPSDGCLRAHPRFSMYIIDLTHYLDDRGAIAPDRGPARKLATFLTDVVAHATDFARPDDAPGPLCFKCRKRDQSAVETGISEDDRVIWWHCVTCGTVGQISRWEGTFWDLSSGLSSG